MGKPIYIKVEKTINHSLNIVWETVANGFGNVSNYNPEIKSSRFEGDERNGIGTRRHCDTKDGGFLKEEIFEWNAQKDFKLKLVDSSYPMSLIESRFSFTEAENGTKLTQEFWYRMKAPMGWLSGIMKGKMKKTLVAGLEGLEKYLADRH